MRTYKDLTCEEHVSGMREGVMAVLYEKSITPNELAKILGIWPTTLNKFIKEEGEVSLLTLMKIDEYLEEWKKK